MWAFAGCLSMAQWGAVWAVAATMLAGCLASSDPAPSDDSLPGPAAPPGLPALDLRGEGCREGGGHSVHPKFLNPLPEPWVPADVLEDVGPQLVYSEIPDPTRPVPAEGNTIGNYHATFACDRWWLGGVEKPAGLVLGFVGMKVEPPPFDDPGSVPTRSYLITVIGAADEELLRLLNEAGFHAVPSTGLIENLPLGHRRTLLDTDGHGIYESLFVPKRMGEMTPGPMRLWWQHEAAGGFRPIALDFVNDGGVHLAAEAQGTFTHTETHDHDPLPGAYGHTAALLYEGFGRTVSWGPRPDVTLEAAYIHA